MYTEIRLFYTNYPFYEPETKEYLQNYLIKWMGHTSVPK
jgi:hypothetical protein